ncbi:MAG TPA: hypothetical protein VFV50_17215 [Bdellovibrionales bacterium]|nr:hypothetical protein [Bdellovibrionales bacterium]
MKNAIVSLFMILAGLSANATSLHPDTFAQVAQLTEIKLDPQYSKQIVSAQIYVNEVRKTIKLVMQHSRECMGRPGQPSVCLGFPSDEVIELPLVAKTKTACGSTIYIAREDNRRADGLLQELRVLDHRTMTCEIMLPRGRMTHVQLLQSWFNRMQGGVSNLKSEFSGPALSNFRFSM